MRNSFSTIFAIVCVYLSCAVQAYSQVIDVTRFGAVVNDGKDDTVAVQKAIEECRKQTGSQLVFPRGQYDFSQEHNHKKYGVSLLFECCKDLKVVGDKAVCMFHGLTRGFGFRDCHNISIRGLIIDWEREPFSVGRVLADGDKYFDIQVFDEFPVSGGETVQAFMDYDPKTRLPRCRGLDVYRSVTHTELIGPQVLRVHLKIDVDAKPGMWMVLRHQVYSYNAFTFRKCSEVGVDDVLVYTCPGMGIYADNCRNISLNNFRVLVRPGTRRLISTTADATHFKSCTGTIRMNNCEFRGMGDDAANFSSLYLTVRKKVDEHSVTANHNLKIYAPPEVGDLIEFRSSETLLDYAAGKVKAVEKMPSDAMCRISFTEPLPADLKPGDVLGNATKVPKVRISNCRVGNNRARGFMIQTRDAVVENCTFENCTSSGICVTTEVVYFFEGVAPEDVVIRNNKFINCNYAGPGGVGALGVFAYMAGMKYPPRPGVLKNIMLENNVIRGCDDSGIFVAGADGIVIRNNRLEQTCRKPNRDEGKAAIYVTSSRNAEITGNKVIAKEQGSGCEQSCVIGGDCEKGSIKVHDNRGF